MNFYNEIDPYAAQWLRNLIAAGHIPAGVVDERSIEDITPDELRPYTQCHFFAGIAGWSHALALAGWPSDRPVWTGSCPCQPFSAAGKGAGFDDQRHLWPAWFHLIRECRPAVVFGEQVEGAVKLGWLDRVASDLEGCGYAFGCVPFPAAGIGAPHIRDRNYWVGNASGARGALGLPAPSRRHEGFAGVTHDAGGQRAVAGLGSALGRVECSVAGGMADAHGGHASAERQQRSGEQRQQPADGGAFRLANAESIGRGRWQGISAGRDDDREIAERGEGFDGPSSVNEAGLPRGGRPGPLHGFWRAADWLLCRDGRWRPVEPGTQPLAHGIPGRVGRLRGYGNAIVPQQAAKFIRAVMGCMP